jgi:hypothetical protein
MSNMKIRTTFIPLYGILILLLFSCSALNKQQQSAIKEFSNSGKIYAEFPKELLRNYSQCLYKSDQLDAALRTNPKDVIKDLDRAVKDNLNRTDFTSEFNLTYKLLDKYFQSLLILLNVDTADGVKSSISTLGVNIDSLISKSNSVGIRTIPLGFGSIAGNLFKYVGKRHIRQQQLKYLKEFMQQGDVLLHQASLVLDSIIIESLVKGGLEIRNGQIGNDFLRYLDKIDSSGKKPANYYKELNPMYLDIKTCYGKAILLMRQLSIATRKLSVAHREMLEILDKKQKKIETTKIASFVESVDQLNELIKQFKETGK